LRLIAVLLLFAVPFTAAARTPHFDAPWRDRVAATRAAFAAHPDRFPDVFRDVVPPPTPPDFPVTSANERWHVDGLLLSWACESSAESPDSWDRLWLDIIDAAWDGAHLYIYLHVDGHSDDGDVSRCQQMLQQHTGRDPSQATWFTEDDDHRLDSIWIRDYGPFFVLDPHDDLNIVDAHYVRYDRDNDDAQPIHFADEYGIPRFDWGFATEGGNFLPNGHGICIVSDTIEGLNPQYSIPEIEQLYADYLGCDHLIILPPLDDVTGHVDMWITWIDSDTLVVGEYTPSQDADSRAMIETAITDQLTGLVDPGTGNPIEIERIPMPDNDNGWVWRNYTNGIWIDDTYLMPVYDGFSSEQTEATATFESHGVTVIPIDADVVITSAGALHCISRTIPTGAPPAGDDDDVADDDDVTDDDDDDLADDDTLAADDDDISVGGDCQCRVGPSSRSVPWLLGLLVLVVVRRFTQAA